MAQCERFFAAHQTVHHAWNCSYFIANSTNRLYVDVNHPEITGTKELSLAHALVSAGVTYAISEACTRSDFTYCPCRNGQALKDSDLIGFDNGDNVETSQEQEGSVGTGNNLISAADIRSTYKWQGCLRNVDFGTTLARRFLDSQERSHITPYSLVNLHNNLVGRKLIKEAHGWVRCQCHGYSGSCTARTCWRANIGGSGEFAAIADSLFRRYLAAKEVSLGWLLDNSRNNLKKQFIQRTAKSSSSSSSQYLRNSKKGTYRKGGGKKVLNKLDENDGGGGGSGNEGWIQKFERVAQLDLNEPHHRRNSPKFGGSSPVNRNDLVYVKQSVNFCAELAKKGKKEGQSPVPCVLPRAEAVLKRKEEGILGDYEEDILLNSCHTVCCDRGYRAVVRSNKSNISSPMIIGSSGQYLVPALQKSNVTEYECL